MTLTEIVAHYVRYIRENAEEELDLFATLPTLNEAVSRAALAVTPDGKRLFHQRRIPQAALAESRRRLIASLPDLTQARSFEELHEAVAALIGPIEGIGELTIYDTALRIGAKLKREPNVVFLHAGTQVGARHLGLNVSRRFIPVTEFPRALQKLKPREIEDVLCIYKDELGDDANPNPSGKGCYGMPKTKIQRTCTNSRAGQRARR